MKKILAFILALTLMGSMSMMFASAIEESEDYFLIPAPEVVVGSETYGFRNPEGWTDVYVYASGGRSESDHSKMSYPGVKLNKHWVNGYGEIYTFTYAVGYYSDLVFNDGKYDITSEIKAKLEVEFSEYIVSKTGSKIPENGKIVITETYGVTNSAIYFAAECDWLEAEDTRCTEMFSDRVCYHRDKTFAPYGLGVYVSIDNVVYDLKTAFEKELIDYVPYGVDFEGLERHNVIADDPDMELVHRCYDALSKEYGQNFDDAKNVYAEPYGFIGDLVLFHGHKNGGNSCEVAVEQIGEYYFYNGEPCGREEHNSVGMYVLATDDEVYTLYEAYTQGVLTDLEKAAELTNGKSIYGEWGAKILPLLNIDTKNSDWQKYYEEITSMYSLSGNGVPDFVAVIAAESAESGKPSLSRFGNYVLYNNKTYSGYATGVYIYFPEKDKVYDFETAFEKHPEYQADLLFAVDSVYTAPFIGYVGNSNGDSAVNINDVTHIQKRLVGRDTLSNYPAELEKEVSDFNNDGRVSIKDATAIQKHLAGII